MEQETSPKLSVASIVYTQQIMYKGLFFYIQI